ncbi:MAG: DNA polymerase Y family protein [Phycisphaerae bacterium]|jgi:protein ImuB
MPQPGGQPGRRVLCLYLPSFPTDRARRDGEPAGGAADEGGFADELIADAEQSRGRPAWAARPPRVLTRQSGATVFVEHACPRAAQRGIRPGMTLAQAQAIAPELLWDEHDAGGDHRTLERLAEWALRFSPVVEPYRGKALLLDVTGCERLFHGEHNLARQAADGARRQGFQARAAIADTLGAAYALACAGDEAALVVPPGQNSAFLAPLPPEALRIDPQVVERLDAVGVRCIGDLLMLPWSLLPARFGPQLVLRLQQALGEVFEPLAAHVPQPPPAAEHALEQPVSEPSIVQRIVLRLLDELLARLVQRGLALRRLDCVLVFEHAPPVAQSVRLSRGTRARCHVSELVLRRLEHTALGTGVVGVRLVARDAPRWQPAQGELFEPQDPGGQQQLGVLLDHLASRLGHEAIVRPSLVDDHQPERAFRYTPVCDAGLRTDACPTVRFGGAGVTNAAHCPVPARLIERPIPIRVIAVVPDGPPTWLSWQGREFVVTDAAGPQRIETGWWRGPDVRRDYFRVSAESGEQFWVFHSATDDRWYLHGMFV